MEFNKQRRKFLIMGGLVFSSSYLTGCAGDDGTGSSNIGSPTNISPEIINHPTDESVTAGTNVTFNVIALGDMLSYQWQMNGIDISGATDATYSTPPVTQDDDGTVFTVTVSNPNGSVTSNQAVLVFNYSITTDSLVITADSSLITTDRI